MRDSRKRWDADNTRVITLKLSVKNDADILARLDALPKPINGEGGGKQGYIKRLIRADIQRNG